jgi:hypothetical protein
MGNLADGVGGYARALAKAGLGDSVIAASSEGVAQLETTLRSMAGGSALLHYANYAYERRGCPHWLVRTLEAAPVRLVTMFHEIYATGPVWSSSFWLSAVQRRLAARIARRSRAVFTSLSLYRDQIQRLGTGCEVHVLPVASTVGEPVAVTPFRDRASRLVVFGGPGGRQRLYASWADALSGTCRRLEIEEVLDIGPAAPGIPSALGPAQVRVCGPLNEAAISEELLASRLGACFHSPAFLGKSTVFAAYCAHGVAPVVFPDSPDLKELEAGVQYWRPGLPVECLADVAAGAREWYLGHSLSIQARSYGELLR